MQQWSYPQAAPTNPAEEMAMINQSIKQESIQFFDSHGNSLFDLEGQKVTKL